MSDKDFTFEDFINDERSSLPINQQAITSAKLGLSNSLSSINLISAIGSNSKADKFKNELVTELTSTETIKNISSLIGVPENNESEDEFVEKALSKISKYLDGKFK